MSTRRLMLLRHGKALTIQPGLSEAHDHARALSERGRTEAAALGEQLRAHAMRPALALVSSARRTRETYDLLRIDGEDGTRCVLSDTLYLASANTLLDSLREQADTAPSVLLVGHNPGLHELALELGAFNPVLAQGFPTCMLADFSVDGDWSTLAPSRVRLSDVLRP